MHYKNGREAFEGDPVIHADADGKVTAGVVFSLVPSVERCNGQIAYPTYRGVESVAITVDECFHAEDAFAAMQELNKT